MRVDSPRPSPHNGICPKGKEGKMIAVFERADNGSLVGFNSDYVMRVTEGQMYNESVIEYGGMAYSSRIEVKGTIQEVVAKLNGKL